ncbi:FecCD family ABC transporter permease [Georgenia subflava]|uniref:Iron chelate uptake ABC transporter family permease subunit n=1 Tax=Georgenia subflava TaxID=1622177 RepID=A0A6N7EHW7_9MICO|nr:iron ABC transporter permease [Georgenia subflava]MPV37719.1 iron chelate uptake ABC transporter family permease subunit [Georgenia subflava]
MTTLLDRTPAAPPTTRPTGRRAAGLLGAVALLALVVLASLALGARDIAPGDVLDALLDRVPGSTDHDVVMDQRVPRTVVGLVVGAALGLAGTIMQGITRNPLADPGLLGVNAGASLFVVLAITFLGVTSPAGFIWFALAGAALAAAVVYGVGAIGREGATPVKLALAGMATTAGATSLITVVLLTDTDALNSYRRWAVGSLAGRGTDMLLALAPFLVVGVLLALATGRTLNLLAMGDDVARGLGQNIHLARVVAAVAIVLLAGCATALAGPIVFVGLVVPHVVRPFTGPDYRWILPYSVILGPVLLVAADVVGRLVVQPGELEAGIVVAVVGAPALIAIVRRVKLAGL